MVYSVIGLMSGTSLDGLDFVLCDFRHEDSQWAYKVQHAETIVFPDHLSERIRRAHLLSTDQLMQLDREFGRWCGHLVKSISEKHNFRAFLAGSHGHTVFHDPQNGYTLQIGHGGVMAKMAGIPIVNDFRSGDIALGGQGAPLVAAGERLLFPQYHTFLNLGGIANIAIHDKTSTIAFDVCPANQLLNHLAMRKGEAYDHEGRWAKAGNLLPEVLSALNKVPYYLAPPPKSISREMVEAWWLPELRENLSTEDLLHTCCHHIAEQIRSVIDKKNTGNPLLVTGGGAYNKHLTDVLRHCLPCPVEVPADEEIQFKEAIIFGFLGLLRWLGIPNVLSSVTGASRDHVGGSVAVP